MLDLNVDERLALAVELKRIADEERDPSSYRARILRGIRDKLALQPVREPLPPPKVYAPSRATGARKRRPG